MALLEVSVENYVQCIITILKTIVALKRADWIVD